MNLNADLKHHKITIFRLSNMSITRISSESSKLYKKPLHRKNDSDELDVFEAARYFSGYNEASSYDGATYTLKTLRDHHRQLWRNAPPQPTAHAAEKKKHKQPSSPGGKLASFLNSIFKQTSSKKKKSSKSATQSMKVVDEDDDESPNGRRKRRSSISLFRSSSSTCDAKSLYSSSSSGFRTPPPYSHTPTKISYRDFRSYSDHKQVISSWLDEKIKISDGLSEKINKNLKNDQKNLSKFNEEDDGVESDSSSDLFELENFDLGIYSSGLPVYETTNMDSIKRGTPISSGTL